MIEDFGITLYGKKALTNYCESTATINIANLVHNLQTLRDLIEPDQFFCPMVKAFAYGHDSRLISGVLVEHGVSHLGVATLTEAIEIRRAIGERTDILVFSPVSQANLYELATHKLTLVIHCLEQLKQLVGYLRLKSATVKVHLEFNTGLNRLGLRSNELEQALNILADAPNCILEGVMTHFACGEDAGLPGEYSAKQMNVFAGIASQIQSQPMLHIYSSASALAHIARSSARLKYGFRPGIALYGAPPTFDDELINDYVDTLALKPVMTFSAPIIKIHTLAPGSQVSYGFTWQASRASVVAVVAAGYADGVGRILSNRGRVSVAGKPAPVIGTVCMDYFLIDVTDIDANAVRLGEMVTIFGAPGHWAPSVDELAQLSHTISYEILTSVGSRVKRILV